MVRAGLLRRAAKVVIDLARAVRRVPLAREVVAGVGNDDDLTSSEPSSALQAAYADLAGDLSSGYITYYNISLRHVLLQDANPGIEM